MLDKLYDRQPGGPPPVNELAEANWKKNPNLVSGGDFETAKGGVPQGWESRGGQLREPLGNLVRWLPEAGNPTNHVIRLTFDQELGDSFGVMYYSDFFPVEEGATYRFQCRWRTNGPAVKVFVKAYDVPPSEYRADPEGRPAAASATAATSADPHSDQRREVYRSQQNLKGEKNVWNTQTEDFTPRHTRYTPRWGRVMLYGYLGAGAVEFDDVVVKQIIPASPGDRVKQPRQSMESGITVEETQQNERRGKDEKKPSRDPEGAIDDRAKPEHQAEPPHGRGRLRSSSAEATLAVFAQHTVRCDAGFQCVLQLLESRAHSGAREDRVHSLRRGCFRFGLPRGCDCRPGDLPVPYSGPLVAGSNDACRAYRVPGADRRRPSRQRARSPL